MVAYAQVVREFFANLDKCNITPILVFDGSVIGKQSTKDQLVLKERAIYQRGLERFQVAKCATEHAPNERIALPQTINHVFKNILSDMGIQRIQCPYEADTHIARIANDLNCPVLTNDSDFIIYSLPLGFIMIDLFPYKKIATNKQGANCIQCCIYSQSRLIKCIPGLKPDSMPLLSILLGNDYVEAGTFDRIINSICNQPYTGALVAETWSHRKIANLLTWLKNTTLDGAIEYVLNELQSGSRDRLRHIIKILLRNYRIEETDNFESELQEVYPADPKTTSGPDLMPAAYLRKLFETSDLSPMALDVVFRNTFYNYAIIDDFQLPSSSYVKYRPWSLAITLLRAKSYNNLTTYRRQIEAEKDAFHVFDRIRDEYCKIVIRTIEELDNFGSLEHVNCYSMITLEPALKKPMLMACFRYNNDELNLFTETLSQVFTDDFIRESSLCFILVKYIGLETKMNPKPQFVDALMLTMFFYAALAGQLNKNSIQDSQYGQLLLKLRPHSIKNNGRQYESSPTLYRRVVHFISQLQSAYVAYCLVNSLLNHVFQVPRYEKFLNSTLIFRLTKLMRIGEFKLGTLCQEIPILLDVCNSIKLLVHCDE